MGGEAPPQPKKLTEKDIAFDILYMARLFAPVSDVLRGCSASSFDDVDIRAFLLEAFRQRCRNARALNRYLEYLSDFVAFCRKSSPPAPIYGPGSIISITNWLTGLRARGRTIPHEGKHALSVVGAVLRANFSLDYPSIAAAAKIDCRARRTHAPILDFDLSLKFSAFACADDSPPGLKLYASFFTLMTLASLRFSDVREVLDFWVSDTAVCGKSVNQKSKGWALMTWAAPLSGLTKSALWVVPIRDFWVKLRKKFPDSEYLYLCPTLNKGDVTGKRATNGAAQAGLNALIAAVGRSDRVTLHSFRGWLPTCASQLQFEREKREKLGRWGPGSIMPELYDRAVCATELSLRNDILTSITEKGWRPAASFEIPGKVKKVRLPAVLSSSASDTSETESDTVMRANRPGPKIDELSASD